MGLSGDRSTVLPTVALSLAVLISFSFASSDAASGFSNTPVSGGGDGLVQLRRSVAEEPPSPGLLQDGNSSFPLAEHQTYRKDPFDGLKRYTGGWNISNIHYWASVSFTAAPLFLIATVWFIGFGLALLCICCCYCCCPRQIESYSRAAYIVSVVLLVLFTCASIVGCIVLYTGQGKFHNSTSTTTDFVVSTANLTVGNLRDFSDKLSAAKNVELEQIFLPASRRRQIDELVTKVNTSANNLDTRTSQNAQKIGNALDTVRLILIIVAAAMLLLAFLGFLFSVLGMQFLVYILVLIGWVLIAGTFILCGVFLVFHNVVADTCISMDEWSTHPEAHTALDDILPCVDVATANESLYQGKSSTVDLINVVNQVISNICNGQYPPAATPLYYNQTGPLMPLLCSPYNPDLSNRTCAAGEVSLNDSSQVWGGFVCNAMNVSGNEICTTVGRVTPTLYNQMQVAVNISYGLSHYGPFLADLQDCTFVRQTFITISHDYCPDLRKYSNWIFIGLAMVSSAVMLSLIFWVVYARERRHRKYGKQFLLAPGQPPNQGKYP